MFQDLKTNERNEFFGENELLDIFSFQPREQDETNYSCHVFDILNGKRKDEISSYFDQNMNLEEFIINSAFESCFPPYKPEKNRIFKVEFRERVSLFTRLDIEDSSANDDIFIGRKRFHEKRRRRENQDNMRKKLKRGFFNNGLVKNMNEILKDIDTALYLEKFPPTLVADITKKSNKDLLNMTLEQIFEKEELYEGNDLKNYYHNLNVIKSKQIQNNVDLKEILNKKYYELFEEYINSKEFKIDEINRLKKNKMQDEYIKRYKYLANHFIEFFSDEI